jgi:hypothetical protein
MHELREFLKDRSQIEKEYAHKMDLLAKKYIKQKERMGLSMMDIQPGTGLSGNSAGMVTRRYHDRCR